MTTFCIQYINQELNFQIEKNSGKLIIYFFVRLDNKLTDTNQF